MVKIWEGLSVNILQESKRESNGERQRSSRNRALVVLETRAGLGRIRKEETLGWTAPQTRAWLWLPALRIRLGGSEYPAYVTTTAMSVSVFSSPRLSFSSSLVQHVYQLRSVGRFDEPSCIEQHGSTIKVKANQYPSAFTERDQGKEKCFDEWESARKW